MPDTPLEAEFFGVAPGAPSGADRKGRDGKFAGRRWHLFLDEIWRYATRAAGQVAAALQEHEVELLGSNRGQRVDVRIVAATSRDLQAMVAAGTFRAPTCSTA